MDVPTRPTEEQGAVKEDSLSRRVQNKPMDGSLASQLEKSKPALEITNVRLNQSQVGFNFDFLFIYKKGLGLVF